MADKRPFFSAGVRDARGSRLITAGARPAWSELPDPKPEFCAAIKTDGTGCHARPAKETELCMGHLRSRGLKV